jgi:hypothetical protein
MLRTSSSTHLFFHIRKKKKNALGIAAKITNVDLVELQDEGVKGKVKKLCGATAVVI